MVIAVWPNASQISRVCGGMTQGSEVYSALCGQMNGIPRFFLSFDQFEDISTNESNSDILI